MCQVAERLQAKTRGQSMAILHADDAFRYHAAGEKVGRASGAPGPAWRKDGPLGSEVWTRRLEGKDAQR
jgi:Ni,Fe-hydrogenase III large subunit